MKTSTDPGKYCTWVDKPASIQKHLDGQMVAAMSTYPPKNAATAPVKYRHIASALQVPICAVIALQITLSIVKCYFKVAS